jgi:hypothetical protein
LCFSDDLTNTIISDKIKIKILILDIDEEVKHLNDFLSESFPCRIEDGLIIQSPASDCHLKKSAGGRRNSELQPIHPVP